MPNRRAPSVYVYSSAVVAATYPGTVSPLRGLDPFGEAERDVWQGREAERDELAAMVTKDGFRAGLVFGEPGVGKTSLVRAGLIPYLRDHGVVALACEDLTQPAQSFAAGLSAFGIQPGPNEAPAVFVQRAVANAVAGQQFVFVVDDVDLLCSDERVVAELSDLYQRVISRSSGRARFLFVCASERLHLLGGLERRTGSLFPPSTRFELTRLAVPAAGKILDRILAFSGVAADPALADAVVQGISRGGQPVLPADLQIAGMAMRDLKITNASALSKVGGPTELEEAWLQGACKATGNERSAMRLCAELAQAGQGPHPGDVIVRRINLDNAYANHAFNVLEQRGVITRGDPDGHTWMLRHEVLTTRVKELTAPTRAAARRAFDLLGSKTASKERLKLSELRALRTEGIAPVTPAEIDVVSRSKRYYLAIVGAIAAVPVLILIIIWMSLRGHVYFDLTQSTGGEHVVVRYGRSGLSGFFWLPGSFGEQIADTGLTRSMVAPEQWKKIDSHDLGASDDDWDAMLAQLMAPRLAGLVDYATGNDAALGPLLKAAQASNDPEDLAELLNALRPIARGSEQEVELVTSLLSKGATPVAPSVQRAAIALAGAAALRHPDMPTEVLITALMSPDTELRRIAVASVRALGDRGKPLFEAALQRASDPVARRELSGEVSVTVATDDGPSVAGAVAVLADPTSTAPLRDRAKQQVKTALAREPGPAAVALAGLISQERAPVEARVFAIEAVYALVPLPSDGAVTDAVRAAFGSRSTGVRAAALPLFAALDPVRAGGELANMLDDTKLDAPLRVAAALAWGEVAKQDQQAAEGALERMLKSENMEVRAAAAQAAGKVGKTYIEKLVKMVKIENNTVRVGAAKGLGAAIENGTATSTSIGGILILWKEKGKPRREAAKVFATAAKKKPGPVLEYLRSAARATDDSSLHPIGVEGLCNAALAGSNPARSMLSGSVDDPAVEVRRLVMNCVADGPDPAKHGVAIAAKLVRDADAEIRAGAARVLALAAAKAANGKISDVVAGGLVALLDDPDRDVRLVAIRAIAGLGAAAPKAAPATMGRLFERADEAEKLALLRTARAIGAADLITIAIADSSSRVRVEAVDAALATGLRASETMSAALADSDPSVRKAALERLTSQKDKLAPAELDRNLALAVRDPNPELAQLAMTTTARVAPEEAVVARLSRSLSSRHESVRAQAAFSAIGLVDREPALGVELLDPLISDPSHDVRVAMLPALAAAYAKTNDHEKLASIMRDSEGNAMRRIVAAAAFVTLARTDSGRSASESTLAKLAKSSDAPMARHLAKLTLGLITKNADGMTFLQELIP